MILEVRCLMAPGFLKEGEMEEVASEVWWLAL